MYQLSADSFIKGALIGCHIQIQTDVPETISGVLYGVSKDEVSVTDRSGLSRTVRTDRIQSVQIGYDTSERAGINRDALRKFQYRCNQAANSPDLTFVGYFEENLRHFLETCDDSVLCAYIKDELARRSALEPEIAYEDYLNRLDALGQNDVSSLLHMMLFFRLRRYSDAMPFLHDIFDNALTGDDRSALQWVCFSGQMKNDVSTFFWLSQYFKKSENPDICKDPAWWYFLKHSVHFGDYEILPGLLLKVARWNPRVAIESIAYLFLMNNNTIQAMQVLHSLNEGMSSADVKRTIELYANFFVTDKESFYQRYLRCLIEIAHSDCLKTYSDSDAVSGYIYDYIPDKKFGFILGSDLLSYFFREESIESNRIRDEIKRNICSFKSVAEEELIQVEFTRTDQAKRSYNAIQIV